MSLVAQMGISVRPKSVFKVCLVAFWVAVTGGISLQIISAVDIRLSGLSAKANRARLATSKGLFVPFAPDAQVSAYSLHQSTNHKVSEGFKPLAGIPGDVNYLPDEGYGDQIRQSDSLGFIGSFDYYGRSEGGLNLPRVVAMGDSFMVGYSVPREASIPGVLESLSGRDVLSLAVGGINVEGYESILRSLNLGSPDFLILSIFTGNDFQEPGVKSVVEHADYVKSVASPVARRFFGIVKDARRRAVSDFRQSSTVSQIVGLYDSYRSWVPRIYLMQAWRSLLNNLTAETVFRNPAGEFCRRAGLSLRLRCVDLVPSSSRMRARRLFDVLNQKCTGDCKLIVVYLHMSPSRRPLMGSALVREHAVSVLNEACAEILKIRKGRLVCLDSFKYVEALGSKAFAPRGNHYSPSGYMAVARQIYKAMIKP